MIVEDVHIDPVISTRQKTFPVLLASNVPPDTRKYKSSRVDGLEVASWHLQY